MIIWIDGTHGIGKTRVTDEIKSKLKNDAIEYIDSDKFKYILLCIGGRTSLQTNVRFLDMFFKHIDSIVQHGCNCLLVEMATPTKESKEHLLDPLKEKYLVKHFLLTASKETVFDRIKNDPNRDQEFACSHYDSNIRFYEENYPDAITIGTDHRQPSEIANEIIIQSGLENKRL